VVRAQGKAIDCSEGPVVARRGSLELERTLFSLLDVPPDPKRMGRSRTEELLVEVSDLGGRMQAAWHQTADVFAPIGKERPDAFEVTSLNSVEVAIGELPELGTSGQRSDQLRTAPRMTNPIRQVSSVLFSQVCIAPFCTRTSPAFNVTSAPSSEKRTISPLSTNPISMLSVL
jgi:hypothetical protein